MLENTGESDGETVKIPRAISYEQRLERTRGLLENTFVRGKLCKPQIVHPRYEPFRSINIVRIENPLVERKNASIRYNS